MLSQNSYSAAHLAVAKFITIIGSQSIVVLKSNLDAQQSYICLLNKKLMLCCSFKCDQVTRIIGSHLVVVLKSNLGGHVEHLNWT